MEKSLKMCHVAHMEYTLNRQAALNALDDDINWLPGQL